MSGLGRLAAAVDEKTGIVQRVEILKNASQDPRVFCAVAQHASLTPILGYTFENRGGACALTRTRAAIRAAGECIERYSSAFYDPSILQRASAAELNSTRAVYYPTSAFYAFSPEQRQNPTFPYPELGPASVIHWVKARDYHNRSEVLVPASCVYMPYLFRGEPVTHAPISTGLAAGPSREECIEKGAAEIIERDALMISWKCGDIVPGLDVASTLGVDPIVDALLRSTSHLPGRWFLHLLTRDIEAPVVSAAFIEDRDRPLTSFGISANRDVTMALRGALEEALLSRFLLNRSTEVVNASNDQSKTYRTLRDHLFGHALSSALKDSFFAVFAPTPKLTFDKIRTRFAQRRTVTDGIKAAGLRVLCTDVTSADIEALGIYCVRVMVPFAEPLDADHETQHLGGKRLREAGCPPGSFNPAPHPFP